MAAMDRCKLSFKKSYYITQATAKALFHNFDNLVINNSSIYQYRDVVQVERANKIKILFQSFTPNYKTLH
jgi:hypothetical protein